MTSWCDRAGFAHPKAGADETARVGFGTRVPVQGYPLPFVRAIINPRALTRFANSPPARLHWDRTDRLFGVFEDDPLEPLLVTSMHEAVEWFMEESQKCGVWLLELEADLLMVVLVYDSIDGKNIAITRREAFMRDFFPSYLKDIGDPRR